MLNDRILYFGDIGNPSSASAIHVRNRAAIFKELGYKVYAVCDTPKSKKKLETDVFIEYRYFPPIKGSGKIRGIKWNIDLLFANKKFSYAKKMIDIIKPKIVILYEVNSVAFQNKMRRYCNRKGINLIIETTEWMETSKERSLSANLIISQKDIQKRYTDRKCKNVIAISSFLAEHYKAQGCNVVCIPPTFPSFIKKDEVKRVKDQRCGADIRLVFAGSLSNKDYLIELIEALLIINKEKIRVSFDVIGPSEKEIVCCINEKDLIKYGIFVHGRKSHDDVLKIVKESDFSVLLRQNKRYAKAGVSTKFCEAMKLGVPSICTQVNGTDLFVENMINGILIKDNSVETLVSALEDILKIDEAKILEMKMNAYEYADKEFSTKKYIDDMKYFLSKCN